MKTTLEIKNAVKRLFPFNELMNVLNEDDILTKMQWSSKLSGKWRRHFAEKRSGPQNIVENEDDIFGRKNAVVPRIKSKIMTPFWLWKKHWCPVYLWYVAFIPHFILGSTVFLRRSAVLLPFYFDEQCILTKNCLY